MPKLHTSAAALVAAARARITEVETAEAIALMEDPEVVIVDLRDPRERERSGFIPGSFLDGADIPLAPGQRILALGTGPCLTAVELFKP